jgi:isochorismate hydrolase
MFLANQALLKASDSILMIIDVQEKFRPTISGIEAVIQQGQILLRAASRLKVPVLVSEQYPKGLGVTIQEFKENLPIDQVYFQKVCFSALGSELLLTALKASGRKQVLIFGVEAHVCVLQTSLELLGAGFSVYVVADAVGSRKVMDRDLALNRLAKHGADIVSTEMVLFEWLGAAGTTEFKDLQQLVK